MAFPLLAAQLPLSILQSGLGTFQFLSALNQAKKNQRPFYNIDPTYQGNIDILTNTMGLPQSALDLYYRNIGQNTNQGINAINASGGNANQIAQLVGNKNASFENIAVQDALQKKQDLGGVIAARLALAGEKDKAFQLNLLDPFKDKAEAISQEKVAGLQNIFGGLNSISGAFANNATNKLAEDLLNPKLSATTTTPNSGVNTNAIIQSLMRGQAGIGRQSNLTTNSFAPPTQNQFTPQSPIGAYNPYITPQPQDNTLDYQALINYILQAQAQNQQTNQYQYGY